MQQNENGYEIGLVMAGAISAGAYSGGVLDFLLEAMRAWEAYRKEHTTDACPLHGVKFEAVSGTSAGGMTAAMLVSAICDAAYTPATGYPNLKPAKGTNVFFESWVSGVDIDDFAKRRDFTRGDAPLSLLDCTVLDEVARSGLDRDRSGAFEHYCGPELNVYVTSTNLRGVPYKIPFTRSDDTYGLMMHADAMHFVVNRHKPSNLDSALWLDPAVGGLVGNWKHMADAALATGAFPVALAARELERPKEDYNHWKWWADSFKAKAPTCNDYAGGKPRGNRSLALKPIRPTWAPEVEGEHVYRFIAVDGGIANNEPLELTRRELAGDAVYNPADPSCATRAVLMVDPFPQADEYPTDPAKYLDRSLVGVALRTFSAMKLQARFKVDELAMAQNSHIFNRYLISPSRRDPAGKPVKFPIASGMLGAFGGFLHEKFREHDFALGRRNCQKFLRDQFVLPLGDDPLNEPLLDNPLFGPLVKCYLEGTLPDELAGLMFFKMTDEGDGEERTYLRILPLTGTAQQEAEKIPWHRIAVNKTRLRDVSGALRKRLLGTLNQ